MPDLAYSVTIADQERARFFDAGDAAVFAQLASIRYVEASVQGPAGATRYECGRKVSSNPSQPAAPPA